MTSNHAEQARARKMADALACGIDDAFISQLVESFYDTVRQDDTLGPILAVAMAVLAGSLFAFPFVSTLVQVYAYAVAMGVAGGMITVLFFTVWGQAFGQKHLGTIQGAAQLLTVLASAAGPLMLAVAKRESGSYLPLFFWLAVVSAGFAVAAAFTRLPKRAS